jgi:predicted NBD/HSP70 family sugar kinase
MSIKTVETPRAKLRAPIGVYALRSDTARTVLRIVHAAQPISRVDLARRLKVTRSTVTDVVKPLLAAGVLCESTPASAGRVGRPPIDLSFRDDGAFFSGVNIGVRRSQVGTATTDGRLLHEESFDTPSDPASALTRIRSVIDRLCALTPDRFLSAIGISVPGPTDAERTRLLFAPQLGWRDVEIAEALTIPRGQRGKNVDSAPRVIVENDATAAALHELRRRLRDRTYRIRNDFVLVRAGTGIGVGLILGGEVYRGTGPDGGLLGEFGHMTVVAGGKPCACGSRGCWERYASATSAAALYAGDRPGAKGGKPPRFIDIVARAKAGELRALSTLERTGEYLGVGIGSVISGLGVTRVVLSGRIVYGWQFIKKPLREAVARTMVGRLANWSVEPGEPTGAGLGGAFEVATEQHLTMLAVNIRAAS